MEEIRVEEVLGDNSVEMGEDKPTLYMGWLCGVCCESGLICFWQ
ncbi:MAG: hypothetical protein RR678_05915 [Lachnospiraceae bacterium]